MQNQNNIIILDRDGVLNKMLFRESTNEFDSPMNVHEVEVFDWVPEALKRLNALGYGLAVATNQPAAAKGKTTRDDLIKAHELVLKICQSQGARILSSHICWHRSEDNCLCRKPKPGMLQEALTSYSTRDISKSWMVGDRLVDLQAGLSLSLNVALIGEKSPSMKDTLAKYIINPHFWGDNLLEFTSFLEEKSLESTII